MANSALEAAVEMAAAAEGAVDQHGNAAFPGQQKRQERAQREATEAFDFIKSS